jgi:hypothetical protein
MLSQNQVSLQIFILPKINGDHYPHLHQLHYTVMTPQYTIKVKMRKGKEKIKLPQHTGVCGKPYVSSVVG